MSSVEIVSIKLGGLEYTGWTSFSVRMAAESHERSFEVVATDKVSPTLFAERWRFEPDEHVQVISSGSLLVDGYIEDLTIDLGAENHEIRVTGKSQAGDATESSVVHDTHEIVNKTPLQIGQELSRDYPWTVTSDVADMRKIPKFRLNPGETVISAIERAASMQKLYTSSTNTGDIRLTKHGKNRHAGAIVEGVNFKAGNSKFSNKKRHSTYTTKGQQSTGTGKGKTQVEQEIKDSGVKRHRPLVHVMDHNADPQRAKERTEHIKNIRQGESVTAEVELQGFRDDGGVPWQPGWLIFVQSPTLRLSQDMAIKDVDFSQDNGSSGSITRLSLVNPKALGGSDGGGGSAPAYDAGLEEE